MEDAMEALSLIGEGREAEVFDCGPGRVLRLMRDRGARECNERQLTAMEAARAGGLRVATVFEVVEVEGRCGLLMERVEGGDLLSLMGKRPWKSFWVGATLGRTHARMHSITGPGGLPGTRDTLRDHIAASDLVPAALKDRSLSLLEDLPDGDSLCHGSFHPGNVIAESSPTESRSIEGLAVIDWTHAMRGDPLADVAKTLLLLQSCEPPPGTSRRVKRLAALGRRVLAFLYLTTYRRAAPLDTSALRRWKFVQAAARLTEGIESERPALLRVLEKEIGRT